jgi:hypothetical protein
MELDKLTVGDIKQLRSLIGGCTNSENVRKHDFEVGKKYFIRSVTHHFLGEVVEVCDLCVVMQNCTWVADDGRFNLAMRGEWSERTEYENYPRNSRVCVYFGGLIDSVEWDFDLLNK